MKKKKLRYAIIKEIDNGNKTLTEEDFRFFQPDFSSRSMNSNPSQLEKHGKYNHERMLW